MGRLLAAAALLTALLAVLPPAYGEGLRCGGGRTVIDGGRYRIYAQGGIYLACLRSADRPTELYEVDTDSEFGTYRVAGRYTAVVAESVASDGFDSWLVLADMRTGRAKIVTDDEVARIALRATGSVAWSASDSYGDGDGGYIRLARFGRRGSRRLATGSSVDPLSLRRMGTRAFWLEDLDWSSARMP